MTTPPSTDSRVRVPSVARRVVLVAGPPCGGKSQYVARHAGPHDVVVCVDTYAREAGSLVAHNHRGRHYRAGEDRFWRECRRVGRQRFVTAWIVRCAPTAHDRAEVMHLARVGRCVLLVPPIEVAKRRARRRDRDWAVTCRAIDSWYTRYRAAR